MSGSYDSRPVRIQAREPQARAPTLQSGPQTAESATPVTLPSDLRAVGLTTTESRATGPVKKLRIGAVGDLHYTTTSGGALQQYFSEIRKHADILLLCGDLTDHGLPDEAKLLATDLASVRVPMIGVLGNHDYESNKQDEVTAILRAAGVVILDGEAVMMHDVGFAGVKGFGGGFDRAMLQPWGEVGVKDFVRGAVDEALKLDSALAKLRSPHRVVLLHYAPVRGTVEGEPLEIFPFLGSSRLEEPVNRYHGSMVVHGHVHRGFPEARTSAGIPVFNVALPLLRKITTTGIPLKVFELEVEEQVPVTAAR